MEAKFKLGEKVIVEALGQGIVVGIFYQLHHTIVQYQVRIASYDVIKWHNLIPEDMIKPVSDDVE
jgi:hypothetical protein